MTIRRLLPILAFAAVLPAAAQTQLVNPTPRDCCECITVKISSEKDPAAPAHWPNPVFAGLNGNHTFQLDVSVNDTPSFDCGNVNITKITLIPINPPGDPSEISVFTGSQKSFSDQVTLLGSQVIQSRTKDWKVKVDCSGKAETEPATPKSTVNWCAVPFTLGRKGCGGCYGGADAPEARNGSFTYELPLGKTNAGDTTGLLRFYAADYTDFGPARLAAFVPAGSGYIVDRNVAGIITGITTPTTTIAVTPLDLTVPNQKSFKVTHSHTGGGLFRVTTLTLLDPADTPTDPTDDILRADSKFEGSTTRHEQTRNTVGTTTTYTLKTGFFPGAVARATRYQQHPPSGNPSHHHWH